MTGIKRAYVQFSKRIVTAVTIAVTIIAACAIGLCWQGGDMVSLVEVVKAYIGYATLVFAAYSGNSAVEKWLVRRAATGTEETDTFG